MLHVMTGVVAAGLVLGVVGLGAWWVRQNRRCPRCQADLVSVAGPDGLHTYEVLACPRCPTAVTLSHGARNRFSFCPRCGQRSLKTEPDRLPDTPEGWLVRVHERCHLCGWADERFAATDRRPEPTHAGSPRAQPPRGIVVEFPRGPGQ